MNYTNGSGQLKLVSTETATGSSAPSKLVNVVRAEPLVSSAPSLPHIQGPRVEEGLARITLTPFYENIDSSMVTADEYQIITRGMPQVASEQYSSWLYAARRQAQPVLDFLFLGPTVAARDREFLQSAGITLVLAVRDATVAQAQLMQPGKAVLELGIAADSVDVADRQELIHVLPSTIAKINNHILQVDRVGLGKRGRVLVYCETGNERSACLVAAYVMCLYGCSLDTALQFLSARRFCINIDDAARHMLQTLEDIVEARRTVSKTTLQTKGPTLPGSKRALDRSMDMDGIGCCQGIENMAPDDKERFQNRVPHAPFIDYESVVRKGSNDMEMVSGD